MSDIVHTTWAIQCTGLDNGDTRVDSDAIGFDDNHNTYYWVKCKRCRRVGWHRITYFRKGRKFKHTCVSVPDWFLSRVEESRRYGCRDERTALAVAEAIWEEHGPVDRDDRMYRPDTSAPLSETNVAFNRLSFDREAALAMLGGA